MPAVQQAAALPPWLLLAPQWSILPLVVLLPFIGSSLMNRIPLHDPLFDSTLRRCFLLVVMGGLLFCELRRWAVQRRVEFRRHLLDIPVGLFFVGMVISASCSAYSRLALFGALWCQDSLPLLGMMVLLYFSVKQACRDHRQIEIIIEAMVLLGGVLAIIGLLDRFIGFGWSMLFNPPRLVSILHNPMFTGTYFAMLVPLGACTVPAVSSRPLRVSLLVCTTLMLLALVLTLTRGAWLALAVTILLLAILAGWLFREAIPRCAVAIAVPVLLLLLALAALNPAIRTRAHSMVNMHDYTVKSRLVYMRSALGMFHAHPLQGWGLGTFMIVSAQFRPLSNIVEGGVSINQSLADALPHDYPLQIAAEMGLLGLLPYLLLILCLLYSGFHARKYDIRQRWLTAGLVTMLLANVVANLFAFDNSLTMAYFWIGAALLAAMTASSSSSGALDRSRRTFGNSAVKSLNAITYLFSAVIALTVYSELCAAHYTWQGATACFHRARALTEHDYPKSLDVSQSGIASFKQAIAVSPIPDYFSYQQLSLAYREQMLAARNAHDEPTASSAQLEMFTYGEQTLRLMGRDPEMLMYLIIEYLDAHRLPEAREHLAGLLRYQPHSSQVHILNAKLLMFEDDYSGALAEARLAVSLDPRYARADLWLGRVQMLSLDRILLGRVPGRNPLSLVTGRDAEGSNTIRDTCANFARAMQLGMPFAPSDHFKYATALFLDGQTNRAIEEGLTLQGHRELDDLCKRVEFFSYVKGHPEQAAGIIARLQQPATPPPPVPPAAPNPHDYLSFLKGFD